MEIVVAADTLMKAVARFGTKPTGAPIIAAGDNGHPKTFEPYRFTDQKELSHWRRHKTASINDRQLRNTEKIKSFLDLVLSLPASSNEPASDNEKTLREVSTWLRENRLEDAKALQALVANYLLRLASGADSKIVERMTSAKRMSHDCDIAEHPKPTRINRIELSRCGKYMAECADDGLLNLYSTRTMFKVGSIKSRAVAKDVLAKFYSVDFSHDGSMLVTASTDRNATVWDTETRNEYASPFEHPAAVADVSFSPDGSRLAVACDDFCVYVWSIKTGKQEFKLSLHTSYVRSVNFSSDGRYLVSSGLDQIAVLWDLKKNAGSMGVGRAWR